VNCVNTINPAKKELVNVERIGKNISNVMFYYTPDLIRSDLLTKQKHHHHHQQQRRQQLPENLTPQDQPPKQQQRKLTVVSRSQKKQSNTHRMAPITRQHFTAAAFMLFSAAAVTTTTAQPSFPSQTIVMTRSGVVINTHQVADQWDNKLVFTVPHIPSSSTSLTTAQQQAQLRGATANATTTSSEYNEQTIQTSVTFVGYDVVQALALVEPPTTNSDDPTLLFVFGSPSSSSSSSSRADNNNKSQLCSMELPNGDETNPKLIDCIEVDVSMFASLDARDGTVVMYRSTDMYMVNYNPSTGILDENDSLIPLSFTGSYNPTTQPAFSVDSILIIDSTNIMIGWISSIHSVSAVMTLNPKTGSMTLQREFEYSSNYFALYEDDGQRPYVYRGSTVDVVDPFTDPKNGTNPSNFRPDESWSTCFSPYVVVNQLKVQVMFGPCFMPSELNTPTTSYGSSMQVYSIEKDPMNPTLSGLLPIHGSSTSLTGIATADGTDQTAYMVFTPEQIVVESTEHLLEPPSSAAVGSSSGSASSFAVVAAISVIGILVAIF
jgi:hypothetical protein